MLIRAEKERSGLQRRATTLLAGFKPTYSAHNTPAKSLERSWFWPVCLGLLVLLIGFVQTARADAAGALLPDGRGYELVSPPEKNGGQVFDTTTSNIPIQAAPDGRAIAYLASNAFAEAQTGGQSNSQYLAFKREGRWIQRSLSVPQAATSESLRPYPLFVGFSPDLSVAVLDDGDRNDPLLAAGAIAGVSNLYLTGTAAGASTQAITTVVPHPEIAESQAHYNPLFETGTADLSHVVFMANDALTPNAVYETPQNSALYNTYESVSGQLRLVNVLPNGTASPIGSVGGNPAFGAFNALDGYVHHAVSDDGSKVFWTDSNRNPGNIYVRVDGSFTLAVSGSQKENGTGVGGRDPNGPQPAEFWTASADGSEAVFTSCEQLTIDSTAASPSPSSGCEAGGEGKANDLYRFVTGSGGLSDLTVDSTDPLGADVQGFVGASDDGSYLYFTANGVLASGASPGNCKHYELSGTCNLYVYHAGSITFIAHLEPGLNGGSVSIDGLPKNKPAYVTPDGKHLAFVSKTSLLGYNNSDLNTGQPDTEVYVYDAEANGLRCVSCGAPGVLPQGPSSISPWQTQNYDPRSVSNDGTRVFFNSSDALLPRDTNGQQDVYEYEAPATGSCQIDTGCLYLLSTGTSSNGSQFIDASSTGNDAFLITTEQLTPQDIDHAGDLYDVKVGATPPPPPPSPPCQADACKPAPSAPALTPTPATLTFTEPATPKTPAVKKNRKHKKCSKHTTHNKCLKATHRKTTHHRKTTKPKK